MAGQGDAPRPTSGARRAGGPVASRLAGDGHRRNPGWCGARAANRDGPDRPCAAMARAAPDAARSQPLPYPGDRRFRPALLGPRRARRAGDGATWRSAHAAAGRWLRRTGLAGSRRPGLRPGGAGPSRRAELQGMRSKMADSKTPDDHIREAHGMLTSPPGSICCPVVGCLSVPSILVDASALRLGGSMQPDLLCCTEHGVFYEGDPRGVLRKLRVCRCCGHEECPCCGDWCDCLVPAAEPDFEGDMDPCPCSPCDYAESGVSLRWPSAPLTEVLERNEEAMSIRAIGRTYHLKMPDDWRKP